MNKLSALLIFLLFFSCNRSNQSSITNEIDSEVVNSHSDNIFLETNNLYLGDNDKNTALTNLPKIMYVTATEGLRRRSEPSIYGDTTGLLMYGERIIIWEQSDKLDTIDEITAYWYRVRFNRDINEWVFGGYISENLPSDLPIIIGKWDNIANEREAFVFGPNYDYRNGRKESSYGIWGSWELNGNIIKVFNLWAGEDYLAVHGDLVSDEEYIQLEIIDTNNIVLIFSDDKIVKLTRSSDLY